MQPNAVAVIGLCMALAGCIDAPGAGPADGGEPFDGTPHHAARPFAGSEAEILAAMVWTSGGGFAGWSSGPSAIVYLTDGSLVVIEGEPWGPAGDGSVACGVHEQVVARLGAGGANFTIGCPAQRVERILSAVLDPRDAAAVRAELEDLVLDVAMDEQAYGCCDRVFTTTHLLLESQVDFVVAEGEAPAEGAGDHGVAIETLTSLAAWLDAQQV